MSGAAVEPIEGRAPARRERSSRRAGARLTFVVLALLAAVAAFVSLGVGRYPIAPLEIVRLLTGHAGAGATTQHDVLFLLRLPRVGAALLVGAALAGAGCAYQGLFRNPMASPDLLGASAGAGFGAALAILLSFGGAGIEALAFAGGLCAVAVTYAISRVLERRMDGVLVLVLAGMVIGNLFIAFTSTVKFVADPNSQLPEITFWLMGGLSAVRAPDVAWLGGAVAAGTAGLLALRWRLNVMTFGDEEALALGVDARRVRYATIVCATLMTSAAVAVAGMVGWVGLIVPHLARLIVGSDNRRLVPASMLMGASFLLVVDDLCRTVYTTEIPLTILTSMIGAPLFVWLVARRGRP